MRPTTTPPDDAVDNDDDDDDTAPLFLVVIASFPSIPRRRGALLGQYDDDDDCTIVPRRCSELPLHPSMPQCAVAADDGRQRTGRDHGDEATTGTVVRVRIRIAVRTQRRSVACGGRSRRMQRHRPHHPSSSDVVLV